MAISAVPRANRLPRVALIVMTSALAVLSVVKSSAGIQGSGLKSCVTFGVVSSLEGGVTAGGVTYSTSGATFKIDGRSGSKEQLRHGDVVSIVGTVASGTGAPMAAEVTFNGNVQGAVSGIDSQSGSFVVLAQTVRVNSRTIFGHTGAPSGLAGLNIGDVVEVSAFVNSSGELVASRVDARDPDSPARITGNVQALNAGSRKFRINSLTVDYDKAAVGGVLVNGAHVVVQGAQLSPDSALMANQVELAPVLNNHPGFDGRLEGLITSLPSSSYFEVEGQPVAVDSGTQLHLKIPLALDVAVQVSGTFDGNGVLVASVVTSHR